MIVETTGMLNNYSGDVVIPETVEYKGRTFKVVVLEMLLFIVVQI